MFISYWYTGSLYHSQNMKDSSIFTKFIEALGLLM